MSSVAFAFLLTLAAGLSTGIGSALAFLTKKENAKFLSIALGFSAGVMVYISFMEILPESADHLSQALGATKGPWISLLSFFAGVAFIGLIDAVIPSYENPHELHHSRADMQELKKERHSHTHPKLMRLGLFTAGAIAVHNFPEGFATFIAVLEQPVIGITIAIAIALHNIPEGIAVSVPIYYATGSRKKAFWYSFASGLAEPAGALIGYLVIRPFLNDTLLGIIFAAIAGIMVYISFDELLPAAREYGENHLSIYGLFTGMAVMAVVLQVLIPV